MGLPCVPGALRAQFVHGRHQVDQPGARQVNGAMQDLGVGPGIGALAGRGQPHRGFRPMRGGIHHLITDPSLVQRGQLRMASGGEHGVGGPQGLPGRPAEQPGRHPRAGHQDDQQAGAVPDGDAVGAGPGGAATGLGAETTWYWV
jgi:hypothetical protein